MTPAEAQVEIRSIAEELLAVEDRLQRVWEAVLRSPDEDAMFEGRKGWDLATEIRTVVECVGEELQRAVEWLEPGVAGEGRRIAVAVRYSERLRKRPPTFLTVRSSVVAIRRSPRCWVDSGQTLTPEQLWELEGPPARSKR